MQSGILEWSNGDLDPPGGWWANRAKFTVKTLKIN